MSPVFLVVFALLAIWGLVSEFGQLKTLGWKGRAVYLLVMVVAITLLIFDKIKLQVDLPTKWMVYHIAPWVRSMIPVQ